MITTAPCGGAGAHEVLTISTSQDYCVSSMCSPISHIPPLKGPHSSFKTWSVPSYPSNSIPTTLPPLRPYSSLAPTMPSYSNTSCEASIGVFNVVFLQGNIKVCQGCHNNYEKSPNPPNNICLQHPEWREFIPPGSPTVQIKWGNAYYHCNPNCVMARWPTFSNSLIRIGLAIQQKLLPVHKTQLYTLFGFSFD